MTSNHLYDVESSCLRMWRIFFSLKGLHYFFQKVMLYSCVSFLCLLLSQITINLWCLNLPELYSLPRCQSLKSVSLNQNQGVRQCCAPTGSSRRQCFHRLFHFSGGCWHSLACGYFTLILATYLFHVITSLSMFVSNLCLFLIKTFVIGFRTHPDNLG